MVAYFYHKTIYVRERESKSTMYMSYSLNFNRQPCSTLNVSDITITVHLNYFNFLSKVLFFGEVLDRNCIKQFDNGKLY